MTASRPALPCLRSAAQRESRRGTTKRCLGLRQNARARLPAQRLSWQLRRVFRCGPCRSERMIRTNYSEKKMLSPHEFATLMLVGGAVDPCHFDRDDLAALVERQLVALEHLGTGCNRLQLTEDGISLLEAMTRKH